MDGGDTMKQDKIELIGNLLIGHDGELYVTTDDGVEHDICREIQNLNMCKYLGDTARVKLIIERQ